MKHQPREVLKSYFREGRRPTQDEFGELIESMLNINDEGFNKTRADGLRISSLGDSNALLSFYHANVDSPLAAWSVGFEGEPDRLVFRRPASEPSGRGARGTPLITLDARPFGPGREQVFADETARSAVGIGTLDPQDTLDVAGAVRARGRRGPETLIEANGRWQPLTAWLTGCQALEVVAGVGHVGSGRFALSHSIALNAFNPTWWDNLPFNKRPIRTTHAFYSRRADRIQLRWAPYPGEPSMGHGRNGLYRLEARTRSSYRDDEDGDGAKVQVKAYVTQLWFDDFGQREEPR